MGRRLRILLGRVLLWFIDAAQAECRCAPQSLLTPLSESQGAERFAAALAALSKPGTAALAGLRGINAPSASREPAASQGPCL